MKLKENKSAHILAHIMILNNLIIEKFALNFISKFINYCEVKFHLISVILSENPYLEIGFDIYKVTNLSFELIQERIEKSLSLLKHYSVSYLVIPNISFENLYLNDYIIGIIREKNLNQGLIIYNPENNHCQVYTSANIPEKNFVKEFNILDFEKRPWLFWMDTKLSEIALMLKTFENVSKNPLIPDIKKKVLDVFYNDVLCHRFPNITSPSSLKLNYKLLFNSLNLWNEDGKLTENGHFLLNIIKSFGSSSIEFRNALHYLILMEGKYLRALVLIDIFQHEQKFITKGNSKKLNILIKSIRTDLDIKKLSFIEELNRVLPIYEQKAEKCWLKIIGIELLRSGLGKTLTQINEELTRRFGNYFQKNLETNFYINEKFLKGKGYIINWKKIVFLIERGIKNLLISR